MLLRVSLTSQNVRMKFCGRYLQRLIRALLLSMGHLIICFTRRVLIKSNDYGCFKPLLLLYILFEEKCLHAIPSRRVYWADAKLDHIEFCNYDGSHRHTVLSSVPSFRHPYALTLFEDWLYWTDWSRDTVMRADKFSGGKMTKLYTNSAKPMDIHAVHPVRQPPGQ